MTEWDADAGVSYKRRGSLWLLGGLVWKVWEMSTDLPGVSETSLWTVYHRAAEAGRTNTVLSDPQAVRLVSELCFPFREHFGKPRAWVAQAIALRALTFDRVVKQFLTTHPDGTVIALGEGLETQFWRVDNGRVQWITVDLADQIELRRQVLPHGPRQVAVTCDVRDHRWMNGIHSAGGVLVTAQGLLMYLEHDHVTELITACAEAFPGATMVFDTVSRRFSARSRRGGKGPGGYRLPPMPWGMDPPARRELQTSIPAVSTAEEVAWAPGRGLVGYLTSHAGQVPQLRNNRPLITRLRFARTEDEAEYPKPSGLGSRP
ncbi:class I SAM-dependent methyltransferase [Streptomyces sp. ISL-99]|uniref:class I SAM-dependent methyltransferase n=1 Tax=Streptomyces sp. ISL-99 TaxID=2819193 RepID=UPI001BEA10DC|nr:class I SAM-dependent methyltransferase [Streptomyces sp. ISL-99]MBT2530189.1 class I SAM-dependent methyltransferase [Streptomyces sp. ISL-99]